MLLRKRPRKERDAGPQLAKLPHLARRVVGFVFIFILGLRSLLSRKNNIIINYRNKLFVYFSSWIFRVFIFIFCQIKNKEYSGMSCRNFYLFDASYNVLKLSKLYNFLAFQNSFLFYFLKLIPTHSWSLATELRGNPIDVRCIPNSRTRSFLVLELRKVPLYW